MELGATHYITKPWEPSVLEVSIRAALRESRAAAGGDASGDEGSEGDDELIRLGGTEEVIPQNAKQYVDRGNSRLQRAQARLALEDFEAALRLDRRYSRACAGQALAYTILGEDVEAEQAIQRVAALGVDPTRLQDLIEELRVKR